MDVKALLPLLLVTALLAGCSDKGGDGTQDDPFKDLPDAELNTGKGLVRGVVVDPSILPVAGATVAVQGGESTQTNDQGAFVIANLDPGTYFLTISKPAWTTVQQSVDVVADEPQPAVLKVQLEKVPGAEPHTQEFQYTGLIACTTQVELTFFPCNAQGIPSEDDADSWFGLEGQTPQHVQVEAVWEHTQEFGKSLTLTVGACADSGCSPFDDMVCQAWTTSPIICAVTVENGTHNGRGGGVFAGTGAWDAKPWVAVNMAADCSACTPEETPFYGDAAGVGIILDQKYDVFVTAFYNFLPDEGWTFVADGSHPVPT